MTMISDEALRPVAASKGHEQTVRPMEKKQKIVILFVDTGDNCRCPMAKGYMQKLLDERGIKHVELRTAGAMTTNDLKPQEEAKTVLGEEGVNIDRHRSRPLKWAQIRDADLILGMTPIHVQRALYVSDKERDNAPVRPEEHARGKTHLLKEYVGFEGKHTQIADPMGGTLEIFRKAFNDIRASLKILIDMDIIQKTKPEPPPAPPPTPRVAAVTPPAAVDAANAPRKRGRPPKAAPAAKPAAKKAAPAKTAKPAAKPVAKKAAPAKPVAKPVAGKPAAKPAVRKAAPAKPAKPAPKTAAKPAAKKAAPAKAAKPVKKAAPAKPAKPAPKKAAPAKATKTPAKKGRK